MKKNIIFIANWKMNLSAKQANELVRAITPTAKKYASKITTIVAPSFPILGNIALYTSKRHAYMHICAQNCFWELNGAYTGEVSPDMLADLSCAYVLLGHSERRIFLKETDEMIHKKLTCILSMKKQLIPVLCIGETTEQKENGQSKEVIQTQLQNALHNLSLKKNQKIIIAYEPVWAIGTGTPMTANEFGICALYIQETVQKIFGKQLARRQYSILYGGSVTSETAPAYITAGGDGVLVGGASQRSDSCKALIQALSMI